MNKKIHLNGVVKVQGLEIKKRIYEFGIQNGIYKKYKLLEKIGFAEGTFYHIVYSDTISPENIKKMQKFIKLDDLIGNKQLSNYETK